MNNTSTTLQMTDMTFESVLPLLIAGKSIQREGTDYRIQMVRDREGSVLSKTEKDGRTSPESYTLSAGDLLAKWSLYK